MVSVPVKIEDRGRWAVSKLSIEKDGLKASGDVNLDIPYRTIVDLEAKGNILSITAKERENQPYRLASVEKVLNVLKRQILLSCSAYRLSTFFMSPAVRGGVLAQNAAWEKGGIAVLKSGIWFFSQDHQICVPLADVASIELTKREVQGKDLDVVKVDHIEDTEVVTSLVLCPLTTLQVLYNFLKESTKSMDMDGAELDPKSAQVAMLVYSGMDTAAIENMLSISHKEVDHIYDALIGLGLAEVVVIRREVKLTTKGVRYITDATKV
ncbi:MAG: taxis protein CheF [Methanofollis sp.]|nr:taxis protein CheF [Methanofollis sp.]